MNTTDKKIKNKEYLKIRSKKNVDMNIDKKRGKGEKRRY